MSTPEPDELTIKPDSLRTAARGLADISHRISGLSQQVNALTSRANLTQALAEARIPAALSAACESWAAALARHSQQVLMLSENSDAIAAAIESTEDEFTASLSRNHSTAS